MVDAGKKEIKTPIRYTYPLYTGWRSTKLWLSIFCITLCMVFTAAALFTDRATFDQASSFLIWVFPIALALYTGGESWTKYLEKKTR